MPIVQTTVTAPNPGDLVFVAIVLAAVPAGSAMPPAGSSGTPVEYLFIIPAVIKTGADGPDTRPV